MGDYDLEIVELVKEEDDKGGVIGWEDIDYLYDTEHNLCVYVKTIDKDLKVGAIYSFIFFECNCDDEPNIFNYLIVKKEKDTYYMVEYIFGKVHKTDERLLSDNWTKCDVANDYNINLQKYMSGKPIKILSEKVKIKCRCIDCFNSYKKEGCLYCSHWKSIVSEDGFCNNAIYVKVELGD